MTFDAVKFEQERDKPTATLRERIFHSSQSIHLEISSCHNYSEGITYYYLHAGDIEIGQYYRDPWGDGWYWYSSISGEKSRCPSKAIALTKIQLEWLRWSR